MVTNGGRATIREVYQLAEKQREETSRLHDKIDNLALEVKGIKSFAGGISFSVSTVVTLIGLFFGWRKS